MKRKSQRKLNDHKIRYKNIYIEYIYPGTLLNEFSGRGRDFVEQFTILKAEKESVDMVHAELLQTKLSTGRRRAGISVDKMMNSILRKYLGVAMTLDRTILA